MKTTLLVCFLSIICYSSQSQTQPDFCEQLTTLNKMVETSHYKPKPLNDSLSKGVYDLFISSLDDNKTIFTNDDETLFKADEFQIDDYIQANDCSFIDKYSIALRNRLETSKAIIESLKTETFNYSGNDTLYFYSKSKAKFFTDEADAKSYWNKRLRYLIISEAIDRDSVWSSLDKNFKTLEKELKPKIIQNQLCLIDEMLQKNGSLDVMVQELFMNAFTSYQDPNSSFFNDVDKTLFEASVSNSQLTFGITTTKNKDGDIVIAHISPGSPASLNGNFEDNDIIKSLTAKKQVLETYCVSNDDITAFISDEKNNTIIFKLKKQNGSIQDVELTKSILKVEENTTTGYVLQNVANVGYIKIPGFYTDLESPNGLGLANDVAKELYKFDKEDIKGLILDLRFNGGGSMKEAADLSGMFINRGPLAILKFNNGETFTVKDMNRGSLFQKPMVILIDNFSASASELFAAAMQDYNCAVIVGSPSHGKSSAQVILPLDEEGALGFTKLTTEAFYRVTGKSHQSIGVTPDIMLPSFYDNFKTSELYNQNALVNDSIAVNLKHLPSQPLPISELQSLSKKRVTNHSVFEAFKKINTTVLDMYINPNFQYALTLKNVYDYFENYNVVWEEFSNTLSNIQPKITVKNNSATEELLQYNEKDQTINAELLKDISTDVYIEEAYLILNDLINLKPSN
jgi:carboxyl-terminal processing protease